MIGQQMTESRSLGVHSVDGREGGMTGCAMIARITFCKEDASGRVCEVDAETTGLAAVS